MAVGFFEGSMASEMSNKEHLSVIRNLPEMAIENEEFIYMIQRTVHLECVYVQ